MAQGLFRNPLADPYLLGSSSGAALGVAIFLVLAGMAPAAVDWWVRLGMTGAAFTGASLAVVLTLTLSRGVQHTVRLLLGGEYSSRERPRTRESAYASQLAGLRILLAEDLTGRGHKTRVIGGEPLGQNPIETLSNRELEVFDRAIDVHVSALRKKLGDDPKKPRFIQTVRSAGYRMPLPGQEDTV